jgi:hypothetical protein
MTISLETVKSKFTRKALIITGAAAGLILAGALAVVSGSSGNTDETDSTES